MSDDLDLTFNDNPSETRECPDCGEDMELRRNMETGSQFFGCVSYPECKRTMPLIEVEGSDRKPRWGLEGPQWDDLDNEDWWANEVF